MVKKRKRGPGEETDLKISIRREIGEESGKEKNGDG